MTDKILKAVAMPGDFIFHSSWFEIFKSFDMATAYAIFMAMIAYVQTGEIPADEDLRRLTVFLFAHIDTDRQRLLSLQPKRRSSAKKKPTADVPAPETEPSLDLPAEPSKQQPDKAPLSETSATSDTSITSTPPQSSHNSQSKPNDALTPRMRADGAQKPLCGPPAAPASCTTSKKSPPPSTMANTIHPNPSQTMTANAPKVFSFTNSA